MSPESQRQPRVLAVDDDRDILRVVRMAFELAAWDVGTAASGEDALAWVEKNGLPDLGVFDMNMPGMTGLELCKALHAFCDLPILFLTVVDDEETKVRAIDWHAEDYVAKPFHPREVVSRARRILRRVGLARDRPALDVRIDDRLSIRFAAQLALIGEREVALTPTEAKILHVLYRASPRVVDTGQLLRRIWTTDDVYEDALRVHVHRLRQKIEIDAAAPVYVQTQRGFGYAFRVPGAAADPLSS